MLLRLLSCGVLTVCAAAASEPEEVTQPEADASPPGMVWIPAGEFDMGSTDPLARPDEAPVHRVRVDGFWMNATEVTNDAFAAFVAATGYVTVAERPVDWEEMKKQVPPGTPKPPDEVLAPGSLVFTPPDHAVDLRGYEQWWSWVNGADWQHPEGPGSDIEGRGDHPVVHIAYEDALAYAEWAGKRLPTEAEWERAARGGLDGKVNAWGDEAVGPELANIWDGEFPHNNTEADGFVRTAPVKSFAANGFGLYDVAGNVWEWTTDVYSPRTYATRVAAARAAGIEVIENPTGPEQGRDSRHPGAANTRTMKGGSFLCNDAYCSSYRPSARMSTTADSAMPHLGFRCVMEPSEAFPAPADAGEG